MSLVPRQLDEPAAAESRPSDAPLDWTAVFAEHGRWLRTVVIARLGEPQAADEVMQELALAVLRQSAPLADRSKLAPWLYRLAATQALLYRRQHGRRRKLRDRYADRHRPTDESASDADPLAWLLADERRRLIRLALGRLTSRDAEILLLKYTEDWSYHELAAHLGISHSAVETRLHRARARLRCELAALEVIEVRG
ncbi:MAG: sigma-70 family RNA polymerase sigma factor [Pirellulales bacterium]